MVRSFTTALVEQSCLALLASPRRTWHAERIFAPSIQRYDGVVYPHETERYCYMPSSPCDNEHRVTN